MRNLSLAARAVLFLVVACGVGLLIGWLVSRQADVKPPVLPVAVAEPPPVAPPGPAPAVAVHKTTLTPPHARPAATPPPDTGSSTNWEQQLEDILLAEDDDNSKSDHILALMPAVSEEAQVELAQHLVNMTQDDHYDGAAGLLTNSATPSAVSTVLMNDLLNRNNTLKLPMLLDVARQDEHPLKDQAREMLELMLQEDHGTNWDDWSASVSTWLAQNQ